MKTDTISLIQKFLNDKYYSKTHTSHFSKINKAKTYAQLHYKLAKNYPVKDRRLLLRDSLAEPHPMFLLQVFPR